MALSFGNTPSHPSSPYQQRVKRADSVKSFPTLALLQVNPGDHIFWDSAAAAAVPASYINWDTNSATTQSDAAAVYLGISLDQKNAADPTTRNIAVVTKGEAAYPLASAAGQAYDPGQYVGPAADGTHNLFDQQMAIAVQQAGAIGRTNQSVASGATMISFEFQSEMIFGEPQAA